MLIRCPDCHLEREINPDTIPASAVMATCPRCKTRFRFRSGAEEEASPDPSARGESFAETTVIKPAATVSPVAEPEVVSEALPQEKSQEESQEESQEKSQEKSQDEPQALPVKLGQTEEPATPQGASTSRKRSTSGADVSTNDTASASEPDTDSPLRKRHSRAKAESEETTEAWLDVPWERPDRYGHLMGLYQTIVRVLFNAPRFFAALPRCRGSIMRPLLFYVALGLFQVLVKLMWFRSIDPSLTDPRVQELISSADMTLAMTFIVSPGILALQLFFYAALFFLMLRLVQPEVASYPVVLRVVAYSSAPMVMCAVPMIGPMVSMIWFAALCFVGCRFALNMPWVKVAMALVPLYLIGFAITMQFVQRLMSM